MQIVAWGMPLEMRERPTPDPRGAEVLLRVEACGVCHSDLHIREGHFDMGEGRRYPITDRGVRLPFTLGHEPVGTVVAKGPDAGDAEVGRSYAVHPWIDCGRCDPCVAGLTQACDAPRSLGTRVDGAYSDHLVVPDARYLVERGEIAPERACTLACSGLTTYSALRKVGPGSLTEADTLLVIGAGGLGLAATCLAKALCRAQVVVADLDDAKLEAARSLGADATVNAGEDGAAEAVTEIAARAGRAGTAANIDLVGSPRTMAFGLGALRKWGMHVHVGLYGGAHPLPLPTVSFRMQRIVGSYTGTLGEFRELVALVRDGLELPVPIGTRPLEEASRALDDLRDGKVRGRAVLVP